MRNPPKTDKILIALQFWNGDKPYAMHLARLLADIEPAMCQKADFLFVSRFDCDHDQATINYVARKFNTFSYVSKRRGTGWPSGCNATFFGTLEWFYHKKNMGQILPYRSIFLFEADGVPMSLNWIDGLRKVWDNANSVRPVCIAGAWLENGPIPDCGHINGNCMMTGDLKFLRWLVTRVTDVSVNVGWDYILAPQFKQHGWANLPQVKSVWRQPITEEIFLRQIEEGTLWWHGVKGDTGIKMARKFLLGQ